MPSYEEEQEKAFFNVSFRLGSPYLARPRVLC